MQLVREIVIRLTQTYLIAHRISIHNVLRHYYGSISYWTESKIEQDEEEKEIRYTSTKETRGNQMEGQKQLKKEDTNS